MVRTFFAVFTDNRQNHVTAHNNQLASLVFEDLSVAKFNLTVGRCFEEGLLATLRNTTNVERTHCQLCTRFTNGLRRDDADGLTNVNACTTCEVTTVTRRTYAIFSFTGQWAADAHFLYASGFDSISSTLVNQVTRRNDNFVCAWLKNIISRYTTQNTF